MLTAIDDFPLLDRRRTKLSIECVKGQESPLLRAEVIIVGIGQFLLLRKGNNERYPEHFQTLKELFYDASEHYMVRSSAAYPLAYFDKFSGEKEKAIETLFDIMNSVPKEESDSRFMGRVYMSLAELTGSKLYSREEWENWWEKREGLGKK